MAGIKAFFGTEVECQALRKDDSCGSTFVIYCTFIIDLWPNAFHELLLNVRNLGSIQFASWTEFSLVSITTKAVLSFKHFHDDL